jgi:hypothetical protein
MDKRSPTSPPQTAIVNLSPQKIRPVSPDNMQAN